MTSDGIWGAIHRRSGFSAGDDICASLLAVTRGRVRRLPAPRASARWRNQRRIGPCDQVLERTWRQLVDRDMPAHCRERHVDDCEIDQPKRLRANSAEQPARNLVHGVVDLLLEANRLAGHFEWPVAVEKAIAPMQQHDARAGKILADRARHRERRGKSGLEGIGVRQGGCEPVLKEGRLAQPQPTKQHVARSDERSSQTAPSAYGRLRRSWQHWARPPRRSRPWRRESGPPKIAMAAACF